MDERRLPSLLVGGGYDEPKEVRQLEVVTQVLAFIILVGFVYDVQSTHSDYPA